MSLRYFNGTIHNGVRTPFPNPVINTCEKRSIDGARGPHGLFATALIPKGTVIGSYAGEIVPATIENCTPFVMEFNNHFIDSCWIGNEISFINHDGNCPNAEYVDCDFPQVNIVAKRDIQANEEITINYGRGYWEHHAKDICEPFTEFNGIIDEHGRSLHFVRPPSEKISCFKGSLYANAFIAKDEYIASYAGRLCKHSEDWCPYMYDYEDLSVDASSIGNSMRYLRSGPIDNVELVICRGGYVGDETTIRFEVRAKRNIVAGEWLTVQYDDADYQKSCTSYFMEKYNL